MENKFFDSKTYIQNVFRMTPALSWAAAAAATTAAATAAAAGVRDLRFRYE